MFLQKNMFIASVREYILLRSYKIGDILDASRWSS